ncbi:RNA degradosome polyphosphate kinase [Bacteroides sp. UBA939]|uniref:RNA degradosome polyphosphate kinase n=1 Tax=Bacteroides sp. UBA939 TaxID=1946092 RepID=UPI0025BF9386|nr:RNA degradosome polyphosphate kinase [Bacteroides sp. UBA939]
MNKKTGLVTPHIERDLSWMYFNRRILQEAMKPDVPLLERLSFLGIYSNNLDEFFRVRMATLSRIAESEGKVLHAEREHAKQLIKCINKLNSQYAKEYEYTISEVTDCLRKENIFILKEDELDEEQQRFINDFFRRKLSGFVSPVWFSAVKRLTDATDESIYLAVKMEISADEITCGAKKKCPRPDYALIELPVPMCGRFIRLPDRKECSYLMYLDDVIRFCLPVIFSGMKYNLFQAYAFKFTKDAEMEIDNDLNHNILQKISKGVRSRKKGNALRVIYDIDMPRDLLKRVVGHLHLDKLDTVLGGGRYHNHKDLMAFPDCGRSDLKYPSWFPILKPELEENVSLLRLIQKQDRYIHVPYHSFDYYIRVLQEAAISKNVKSIKTTLYRLAKDSKVVKALICAAHNGKKVTVVIELLARFDEVSNIDWSKKMQDAGIHVIFGVEGLKVHSKIVHIGMKSGNDIACISTGNFHEGNARMYTDYMLMTTLSSIVRDVDSVFSFIEKPYSPVHFKELLISPNEMKSCFIRLINEEIKNRKSGRPAYIRVKVNHITDPDIIKKLYEASAAGVPINMLVRGNCSLVTGIPGLSDTIHINGIIDRYLEHSRIFIFAANGENKTFIGSADWMPRNLDNRIEVITPVYDVRIKEDLWKVIDFGLRDTRQGSIVDGTGENRPWVDNDDKPFRSQEELYKHYIALNDK